MREAITESVTQAWQVCASHPSIRLPDVIVEIQQDSRSKLIWNISHESTFQEYLEALLPTETVQASIIQNSNSEFTWVLQDSLQLSDVLGGRGAALKHSLRCARAILHDYWGRPEPTRFRTWSLLRCAQFSKRKWTWATTCWRADLSKTFLTSSNTLE
jgi:hypothetical protein